MSTQQGDFRLVLNRMAYRLLNNPGDATSTEAIQVATLFAAFAWNESVDILPDRDAYRKDWEPIEAGNPLMWDDFKSNDIDEMLDELVAYKKANHTDDQRRLLRCGFANGKLYVEAVPPALPGVDSQFELVILSHIRNGKRLEALELLKSERGLNDLEAVKELRAMSALLGTPPVRQPEPPPSPAQPAPSISKPQSAYYKTKNGYRPLPIRPENDLRPPLDEEVSPRYSMIEMMIRSYCHSHLNDDYLTVCLRLLDRLARITPSPLRIGKSFDWSAAIVRTIGVINFLDIPTSKPHKKLWAIDKVMGAAKGQSQAKSIQIIEILKIFPHDPAWTLPSRLDPVTLVWMIELDGFPVDVRRLPRDIQEEALRLGLIPRLPGDK